MGEESSGECLTVQRKVFSFRSSNGFVQIMEKSRSKKRALAISLEQSKWCLSSFRRLISLPLGSIQQGKSVQMVMRKNGFGWYIKIEASGTDNFIFVPLGSNGSTLETFMDCLWRLVFSIVTPVLHSNRYRTAPGSYAQAVSMDHGFSLRNGGATDGNSTVSPSLPLLLAKIASLEAELSLLRAHLRLEKSVGLTTLPLEAAPYERVALDLHSSSEERGRRDPTVLEHNLDRADVVLHGCEPVFWDPILESSCHYNTDFKSDILEAEQSGSVDCVSSDLLVPVTDYTDDEITNGCSSASPVLSIAQDDISVDPSDVQVLEICPSAALSFGYDCETEHPVDTNCYSTAEQPATMGDTSEMAHGNVLSNSSSTFTTSSFESDSTDNNMVEGKDSYMSLVEWSDIDDTYNHYASGLSYQTKIKAYFTWVSDEDNDLRVLWYKFVDGEITLIQDGKGGAINEETMKEQDWDRSYIFTEKSEGYHPDLEMFFKAAFDKEIVT